MRQRDNLLLVVLVLGAIAWLAYRGGGAGAFGGEEPLVKKVACDACGPDGKVPEGDSEIGRLALNGRKVSTPYCRKCQGTGSLLVLPNGEKSSAATADQVKAYDARIKVLELTGRVKRAEESLAKMKADLKTAQEELTALEKKPEPK